MPLPSLTVTGNVFDILADGTELAGIAALDVAIKLTSNVPAGRFVTWDGDLYRVPVVHAAVKSDGSIVLGTPIRGGVIATNDPVRLLANDPGLSVQDVQWTVEFYSVSAPQGHPRLKFVIDGEDGATIDLATVTPAPGMSVSPTPVLADVDDLTDATATGKALVRAASAADARNAVRALGRFARPTAFGFDWGFDVRFDGTKFVTDYDAATRRNRSTTTLWVHPVLGSDTNGDGTPAKPFKTWTAVYTAAADGDTIIWAAKGLFFRNVFQATTGVNKSLNVIAKYPGETFVARTDSLTWAANATYPNVYEAARTNVRKVIDISLDPEGAALTRVADLAACNSTRGSWYQATNGTGAVYVHRLNHEAPTADTILPLITDAWFNLTTAGRSSNMNFYLEGFTLYGARDGISVAAQSDYRMKFTAKKCAFLHGGYGVVGAAVEAEVFNGLSVVGNVDSVCQDVTIAHCSLDGFNYHHHPYNEGTQHYLPSVVEIGCVAHDCGTGQIPSAIPVGTTQNCSTFHDGIKGISIGCRYWKSYGSPVTDVDTGTQRIMLSCDVGHTTAPSGTQVHSAIRAGNTGGGTPEIWAFGCYTWGATNGLYAAPGTSIRYDAVTASECSVARAGTGAFTAEAM